MTERRRSTVPQSALGFIRQDDGDTEDEYTIQVYGGDAGGLDQDFYAATLAEARKIAREEHVPGSRETEILDRDYAVVETYAG